MTFEMLVLGATADFPQLGDGYWLNIGACWDEYRMLVICCDGRHSLFGAVVSGQDAGHPWSHGVP
jgi:hypothetical protein